MSKTASLIQDKIDQKLLSEAQTILQHQKNDLSVDQYESLHKLISQSLERAEALIKKAKTAEQRGNVEEALNMLNQARVIATDYPGLKQQLMEINDAVQLTRAFKTKALKREAKEPVLEEKKKTFTSFTAYLIIFFIVAGGSTIFFFFKSNQQDAKNNKAIQAQNLTQAPEKLAKQPSSLPKKNYQESSSAMNQQVKSEPPAEVAVAKQPGYEAIPQTEREPLPEPEANTANLTVTVSETSTTTETVSVKIADSDSDLEADKSNLEQTAGDSSGAQRTTSDQPPSSDKVETTAVQDTMVSPQPQEETVPGAQEPEPETKTANLTVPEPTTETVAVKITESDSGLEAEKSDGEQATGDSNGAQRTTSDQPLSTNKVENNVAQKTLLSLQAQEETVPEEQEEKPDEKEGAVTIAQNISQPLSSPDKQNTTDQSDENIEKSVSEKNTTPEVFYTIKPGDSLSTIADKVLCNEKARFKLLLINKDIIENPKRMKIGTKIRLQSEMVTIDNRCEQ